MKVEVKDTQSLFDLAIQYYGSAEGIIHLLNDNREYSFDSPPPKGTMIVIDKSKVINKQMVSLIEKLNLTVATGNEFQAQDGNFWVDEFGNNVVDENGNYIITE